MLLLFIVPCHVSSSDAWLDCTCVSHVIRNAVKRILTHKSSLVTRRFCLQGQENMSADLILVWLIRKWQSSPPWRTNKFFGVIVTIVSYNFRLVHCQLFGFFEMLMRRPKYIELCELVWTIWSNRKCINWWFGLVEIRCQPQKRCRLAIADHTEIVTGNYESWKNCHMDMVQPQKVVKAEIIWVGVGIRENCHQFGCNLATTLVAFLWCRNSHNHTFSERLHCPCLPQFQDWES